MSAGTVSFNGRVVFCIVNDFLAAGEPNQFPSERFLNRLVVCNRQFMLTRVDDDLVVAFGLDYAGIGFLIGLFMAPGLVLALPAG